jgi:hypothetical protein
MNEDGQINGMKDGWVYHRGGSGLTGFFSSKGWTWEGKGPKHSGEWYLDQTGPIAYWMGPSMDFPPVPNGYRGVYLAPVKGSDGKTTFLWETIAEDFHQPVSYGTAAAYGSGPTGRYVGAVENYGSAPTGRYVGAAESYGSAPTGNYVAPSSAANYGIGPSGQYYGPGSAANYSGGARRRHTRRKQKKQRKTRNHKQKRSHSRRRRTSRA